MGQSSNCVSRVPIIGTTANKGRDILRCDVDGADLKCGCELQSLDVSTKSFRGLVIDCSSSYLAWQGSGSTWPARVRATHRPTLCDMVVATAEMAHTCTGGMALI